MSTSSPHDPAAPRRGGPPSGGLRAWIQASRPLAHANLAPPLLVGAALAWGAGAPLSWVGLGLAAVFGVLDHLLIVFANDVADEAADRAQPRPTLVSGGSRVLVDGRLSRQTLARAAAVAAAALVLYAAALARARGLWFLPPLAAAALGLLWAYSFAPLRLSYGRGGALVQGLGVGLVLPAVGYGLQAGQLAGLPWQALVPLVAMGVAGNMETAIPDAESDARCSKLTYPARVGAASARRVAEKLIAIAILLTPLVVSRGPPAVWATIEAVGLIALLVAALRPRPDLGQILWASFATVATQLGWVLALWP